MDAMLKRRMWKVAIVHYALSFLGAYLFMKYAVAGQGMFGDFAFLARVARCEMWNSFLSPIMFFLQPQRLLFKLFYPDWPWGGPLWTILFCYFSAPVWSICFSRFFIRGKDWLNHFPVLGKRVF